MRVEHTYELSALAKSLKKQLGLTTISHAAILETLAKAANEPSYGHMLKKIPVAKTIPWDSEEITGFARTDDDALRMVFDARSFLLNEDPREVLCAVLSEVFLGGFDEHTDKFVYSSHTQLQAILAHVRTPGIKDNGFEASLDGNETTALKFLRDHRPEVLVDQEDLLMQFIGTESGILSQTGKKQQARARDFISAPQESTGHKRFDPNNTEALREFFDVLIACE